MPKLDPNGTFPREKELIAHVANNLHLIENGLRLFNENGNQGVEHPLFLNYNGTSPRMDVFAIDSDENLVVIECKVEHAHPAALGQLAAYAQWIKENLPNGGRPVRTVLVCKKASPMLWYAARQLPDLPFSVYRYTKSKRLVRLSPPKAPLGTDSNGQLSLHI